MTLCIVKESGLCPVCATLGRKQNNEPNRVLELNTLCKACMRKLKSSYVEVVKEARKHYAVEEESKDNKPRYGAR